MWAVSNSEREWRQRALPWALAGVLVGMASTPSPGYLTVYGGPTYTPGIDPGR